MSGNAAKQQTRTDNGTESHNSFPNETVVQRTAEIRARLDSLDASDSEACWSFVLTAAGDIAWLLAELDAAHERIALLRTEVTDLEQQRAVVAP